MKSYTLFARAEERWSIMKKVEISMITELTEDYDLILQKIWQSHENTNHSLWEVRMLTGRVIQINSWWHKLSPP